MSFPISPSQTIGPFPHEAWQWAADGGDRPALDVAAVTVSGIIRDGDGQPISDAQIEAWMPDVDPQASRAMLPQFQRVPSGVDGEFTFSRPVKTGRADGEPAFYVTIFARGLVAHQFTCVFLNDDPSLADSPLLQSVPAPRRDTLVAKKRADGTYGWDIWMQSALETVFFDYR